MPRRIFRIMHPIKLSEALAIVEKNAYADATATWYEAAVRHLIRFTGDIPAKDITLQTLNNWSGSLDRYKNPVSDKRLKANTKNGYRRAVRAFFNHLKRLGHIKQSPAENFAFPSPSRQKPRHLQDNEITRILTASVADLRDYAMVRVLHATGCRIGELPTMHVSDTIIAKTDRTNLSDVEQSIIELARETGNIHLIDSRYLYQLRGKSRVTGKGQNGRREPRPIFFDHQTCTALLNYLEARPHDAPDEIWLQRDAPVPVTKQSLYHAFKQICKRAGVTATPHQLRHSFIHRNLKNGEDPKAIQRLVGHGDVLTTMRYYHDYEEEELWDIYDTITQNSNGVTIA